MSFALGTAIQDITPPLGLPMGGYAARSGPATSTLDPLCCRVAVCRSEGHTAAMIALDLLYVCELWSADLRHRVADVIGSGTSAVMIAATHTHAGPGVFRSALVESEELRRYESRLAELIVATVVEARDAMRQASLFFGEARVDGVAANRQENGRRIDDHARVVVARDKGGTAFAAIASFGCHPTVLPAANVSYSRDLFGAAVDIVEEQTGMSLVLCNGGAADVSTRFTRTEQTPAEVDRLGKKLAAAIRDAIDIAKPVAAGPITSRELDVDVTARVFPPPDEARHTVARAMAQLDSARERVSAAELRLRASQLEGAMAQLYFSENGGAQGFLGRAPRIARVQLLRLGGCDLVAAPGEIFSAAGAALCARRSRPALLIGYANDYLGYLVPPGSLEGYETLMALLTVESSAAIMEALGEIGEGDAQQRDARGSTPGY